MLAHRNRWLVALSGVGIHLSLTNEYQERWPWAPVLPREQVPTLYNPDGLAWSSTPEVQDHVDPREAQLEFEAQIAKAIAAGIEPTHVDSHMATYYVVG